MKKILIPIDFSPWSENAEKIGLEIAKDNEASIDFIYVDSGNPGQDKFAPSAKLGEKVEDAEKMGIPCKSFFYGGKKSDLIIAHAEDQNYDLVIIGSHKKHGIKGFFTRSLVDQLIRKIHIPILTINQETSNFDIENIVYASDFSEDVSVPWLKIIEFADMLKADIHLLYVNEPETFQESSYIEKKMEIFLKNCPRGTCSINIYNAGYAERGVIQYAENKGMDMIALISHGQRKGLRSIETSLTERIVGKSELPVLSVNINPLY